MRFEGHHPNENIRNTSRRLQQPPPRKDVCLADHGKHRWRYRLDSMLGKLRECQKCGVLQQQRGKRYVQIVKGGQ